MRRENKFVFHETALGSVYTALLTSRHFFSEIYSERRVNNIYLDSMTLDNYRDNLNGVQNRIKHRIRWYGEVIKVEEPILEYKIKQGELGYKESYPLLGFVFDEAFRFEDYLSKITNNGRKLSPEEILMHSDISLEIPTLYNTYRRRYFLSGDGKYRITLDTGIYYKSFGGRFNNAFPFSEDKIVVELKYENEDTAGASRIMQDLGLRMTRNSKYVIGIKGIYFNNFD